MKLRATILLLTFLALAGCSQPAEPTTTALAPQSNAVIKGIGISPLGFPNDFSQFAEFLAEVGAMSDGGVMFNGAWREDVAGGSDAGQIPQTPTLLVNQASNYGYTPIIVFGWRSTPTDLHLSVPDNTTNDWSNEQARQLFKQMLVDFAAGYQPPYLFLGNESDVYYSVNPEDYGLWVDFYNEAYDAIKAASPSTQVGPVFQFEHIAGRGTFSQWTEPLWGALETHDLSKVDLIGLTLYPWLGASTPEEVPDDYLAPLLERIGDTPLAITETGWPGDAMGLPVVWEASPEAQLRYLDTLQRMLQGVDVRMLNWLHLYQMTPSPEADAIQEFASIALKDTSGEARPIYEAWLDFQP